MLKTIFDVSSNGVAKHIATNVVNPEVLSASVHEEGITGTQVAFFDASLSFVTLLFAVSAVFFVMPQIHCLRDFFSHCFKPRCWYRPWKRYTMDLVWWFVNVFTIVAIVDFFWTRQQPRTRFDVNIFIAVLILVLLFLTFRWFWVHSFWNFHNLKGVCATQTVLLDASAQIALGFALFFAILMFLTVIALGIVFIIIHAWLSLVFLLPIFLWTIVLLVWTAMVYACVGCKRVCEPVCPIEPVCPQVCPQPLVDACGRPIGYANQAYQNNYSYKK